MFRKEDEGKRSSLTHFRTEEVPSTFLVSICLPPLTFSGNPAALCHCFSGVHLRPSHKPCQRQIPLIWGGKGSPTVRDWLYPQEIGAGTEECNQLSIKWWKPKFPTEIPTGCVLTWPGSGCALPAAHEAALSHTSQSLKSWHFFLTSYHLMAGKSSVSEED